MQFIVRRHRGLMSVVLLMSLLLLPLLAQAQDSGGAFVSIRHYDGIDPADQSEIGRIASEGFLPIIRQASGFIGYYLAHSGDELVAVSLFDSQEQASASNELAREFVAENMAPLLPNPPRIIEGTVAIEAVADDAPDGFFASVRIYDDQNMETVAETNARTREIFLPALRETAGFFSYYVMNDGNDVVAAVNVFESEEAALASNDMASEFVAEHLAEFDLGTPARISGQVSVAALAAWREGENLVMEDASDFVSIRRYEGIDPADQAEIRRVASEGFFPIIRDAPGFVGYYLLHQDDILLAVSLFETQEQASDSNELAREFVAENMAPLLPNPPRIIEGQLDVEHVALSADDDISALFASVRIYDDYDLENLDESNARVREVFLPQLSETLGFFGYYTMNDGEDALVAMNIFVSEEASLASNDMARQFVAEHLAEFNLGTPSVTSGSLSVAALAAWDDGANLVESGAGE